MSIFARKCSSIGLMSLPESIDLSTVLHGAFVTKERIGLSAASGMLGIKFDGFAHGALPDARNTALIHASILRRLRQQSDRVISADNSGNPPASISSFAQKLNYCLNK